MPSTPNTVLRTLYFALMILIPAVALLLVCATFTYSLEKILIFALAAGGTAYVAGKALNSNPVVRKLYVCAFIVIGSLATFLMALAGPPLLDRQIDGLTVYSLVQTKASLQEEAELTIYRHRLGGKETVTSEFYENGWGVCRPYITNGEYGMDIGVECK